MLQTTVLGLCYECNANVSLNSTFQINFSNIRQVKNGMFLYSAVSSPLDRSNRFTLSLPWQTCSFRHQLGFSWKHSSHAAITQRLFTHISTTGYSQVIIYTAEWTETRRRERKCPNFETVAKEIRTRALSIASSAFYR